MTRTKERQERKYEEMRDLLEDKIADVL